MKNKNNLILIAVLLVLAVGTIYQMGIFPGKSSLSTDEIKSKVETYFTNNNLSGFSVIDVFKYKKGLYTVKVEGGGTEHELYVTEDGDKFFPNGYDLNTTNIAGDTAEQTVEVEKSAKPNVELFVMSHCPYGTQVEKGILPVLKTLGDKIDFSLKFVYYAMHGEVELKEQATQYCISKNEPEKLIPYLECFLADGEGEKCISESNINKSILASCVDTADSQFSITKNLENTDTWLNGRYPLFDVYKAENDRYSIQGSPTLVINGSTVNAGRDPSSLLSAVCAGFNEAPEECNTELSSTPPSAGFGYGTGGPETDGSCN
ncbi:hypothetical protein JXA34_04220 [Patescibacteria group bacterium]|nr:hypothetical protein [Patescibacteria group bacterium]